MRPYYIITFGNATHALLAEDVLRHKGGVIIPLPPVLGDGCGFAIKLPAGEVPADFGSHKAIYLFDDGNVTEIQGVSKS